MYENNLNQIAAAIIEIASSSNQQVMEEVVYKCGLTDGTRIEVTRDGKIYTRDFEFGEEEHRLVSRMREITVQEVPEELASGVRKFLKQMKVMNDGLNSIILK